MVGHEDVHSSESGSEFLESNHAVVVLVEVLDQVDNVLLEGSSLLGLNLQLSDDLVDARAWELVGVVLHVFFGVLVSLEQLELESSEEDALSNQEVFLFVVSVADWTLVLLSLHEFSSNSSGVLVANLVDLDGVVTAVERNNESSGLVIWLSAHQLGLESENVHVLLEHFLHVNLGWLGVQGVHGPKRVLLCSVTVVGWQWLVHNVWSWLLQLHWLLVDAQNLVVEGLGEVVAVVDLADSSVDVDVLAAGEVVWGVELLLSEGHAWAVGHDWGLSELLSLKEHWEWESSGVSLVDFFHFNAVVGEEVVQDVVFVSAIVRSVFPEDVEGQNFSVVFQKAL